ncbi:MAG: pyridoxal-phosphate dependent enzyme [Gammaproteobacteria bacterium]
MPPSQTDTHDNTQLLTSAEVMAKINEAVGRLQGAAHVTPVFTSTTLDARASTKAWLKCEQFQRVGAFKFRGAYNALSALSPKQRACGVLTFSSGNHAQAMALASSLLDIHLTVVMPENAPAAKLAATREYGANVVTFDPRSAVREEVAASLPEAAHAVLVPPFDHYDVIAGQGTAAFELHHQVKAAGGKPLDVLLVPVGGGGLLSGSAVATHALSPHTQVIGVEPANADDAAQSLRSGHIVRLDKIDTIADGTRTPAVGVRNFALMKDLVTDIVTVSEQKIADAVQFLFERLNIVVEPSGALGIAALLSGAASSSSSAGVILSGGNVDAELYASIIQGRFGH